MEGKESFQHFLSTLFLVILFPFIISCSSSEKERQREREEMYKQWGQQLILEVENSAVLLSLKYDISNLEVEQVLYNYICIYDNFNYQLITSYAIDMDEWDATLEEEPPGLYEFINNTALDTQLPVKTVAGVILDYRFMGYSEDLQNLETNYEDLKFDIEQYQE